MWFIGLIVGLVVGAAIEDFEGAFYGAALGALAGYALRLALGRSRRSGCGHWSKRWPSCAAHLRGHRSSLRTAVCHQPAPRSQAEAPAHPSRSPSSRSDRSRRARLDTRARDRSSRAREPGPTPRLHRSPSRRPHRLRPRSQPG